MSDSSNRGWRSTASRVMASRSWAGTVAAPRWGGCELGTKSTRSRCAQSIATRAAATSPTCTGSKFPPMIPTLKAHSRTPFPRSSPSRRAPLPPAPPPEGESVKRPPEGPNAAPGRDVPDLLVNRLEVCPGILPRPVKHVDQTSRPLDVAEESKPQPGSPGRALDQPRDVRDHDP